MELLGVQWRIWSSSHRYKSHQPPSVNVASKHLKSAIPLTLRSQRNLNSTGSSTALSTASAKRIAPLPVQKTYKQTCTKRSRVSASPNVSFTFYQRLSPNRIFLAHCGTHTKVLHYQPCQPPQGTSPDSRYSLACEQERSDERKYVCCSQASYSPDLNGI